MSPTVFNESGFRFFFFSPKESYQLVHVGCVCTAAFFIKISETAESGYNTTAQKPALLMSWRSWASRRKISCWLISRRTKGRTQDSGRREENKPSDFRAIRKRQLLEHRGGKTSWPEENNLAANASSAGGN